MNSIQKIAVLATGILCLSTSAYAYKFIGDGEEEGKNTQQVGASRAAACAPATALRNLEWNNVRALIETGGSMWQNRSTSQAAYEVPKDGGVSVLYAGALWLGGISPDQQLKLAAVKFRGGGNDFWPGPLTNDGRAEVDETTCAAYDKFFVTTRAESERHRQYFDCLNDPNCDIDITFPDGYSTPSHFKDYPAHGNTALGQDYYLAPFYDYDGDGFYDPNAGDYPWYDFLGEIDCFKRKREDAVPLFGDRTFYWIFNDKGNVHSESQGEPIGIEVRAQAFAFSTNDEVNNMTFYNYVIINQGTQTLGETFFGQWVDPDIGTSINDYVGCDVQRGLGYAYNGTETDPPSSSSPGYGSNPPAVGIDFFEGPFQDADGLDNPLTSVFTDAIDSLGIPYRGIGIGYGDGVIDNERFGMRKFLYYNNNVQNNGEPTIALDYYNYLKGFWRNGQRMSYYGDALNPGTGANLDIPADYMFPDDTDPFNWGTEGVAVDPWTELTSGNAPQDRRFIQSAGPFTLEPGDYNNVTVGVVYARANAGNPFESVKLVQLADDKAQALFDNCFQIVSGPDAPDVTIQEFDKELILYLTNNNPISNNFRESYVQFDPSTPEFLEDGTELDSIARSYVFQGYQIWQLANATVSPADLTDVDKARLIFQCDIKDTIGNAINYQRDLDHGLPVPSLMVKGSNNGIQHSFQVTQDAFAQGNNKNLINHKTYYFMALAYGYNKYREYNPSLGTGQDEEYKGSRKGAIGSIKVFAGIPHNTSPQGGGTKINATYGDGLVITQHEGRGNGIHAIDLAPGIEDAILAENGVDALTYQKSRGPVEVRVIDPLMIPKAEFELRLAPDNANLLSDTAFWTLTNLTTGDVYNASRSISALNEELLLEIGLSINWNQYTVEAAELKNHYADPLESSISFADSKNPWLGGIYDQEGFTELNWIRSGTSITENGPEEEQIYDDFQAANSDDFTDPDEKYESIINGSWAPYCLTSYTAEITNSEDQRVTLVNVAPSVAPIQGDLSPVNDREYLSNVRGLNNVDVVITSDKSKWTRCGVIEMRGIPSMTDTQDGEKWRLRKHLSVDKNGRSKGDAGYNASEGELNGHTVGMGWFPGYAIDVSTGERLNMAFGEDSWLGSENGRDMIWNPTDKLYSEIGSEVYAGGQHWIFVFKNHRIEANDTRLMPSYDEGKFMYSSLESNFSLANQNRMMRGCTWVGSALINQGYSLIPIEDGLIPNDVRIKLRVAKAYQKYHYNVSNPGNKPEGSENNWNPLYTFDTYGISANSNDINVAKSALDRINVVPNPYYAYSSYESNKLDNRVKITNLPEKCTVTIFNVNGTLVRQFKKGDPSTSIDWDLKNTMNIPIAGGVYIIHVDVPGVGEKVIKWFGVMRPVDLDNF